MPNRAKREQTTKIYR
ncbi:hypothetical protein E2C01_075764 [Portunus trituberculatus]|uniref:Uncharacterized protein n=1 Tax=Portunus trituberculatus TaxID=210409 RepID=A0A5B7IH55_PORTR|nr:hypothetical protein [Portunus trituberculatus]